MTTNRDGDRVGVEYRHRGSGLLAKVRGGGQGMGDSEADTPKGGRRRDFGSQVNRKSR